MKYLLFFLFIFVCACSDNSAKEINQLKSDIRDVKFELSTCESSLSTYRNIGSSSGSTEETVKEEKPSEPEYETVKAYRFKNPSFGPVTCNERNDGDYDKDIPCGMTFSDCEDGHVYRCLTNVEYKIIEKKKLIDNN